MNRIDWLIATGGNPCFELAALGPLLTPLLGETAAGIIGPALIGAGELGAGGAALGGITGGGQGALRGAEIGGLTGAGIFGGGPAAAAAGLPATVGTTAGGVLGGTLGGVATGENPLLTGAAGGLGGLGAGLSGVAGGTAPAAPAAASTAMTPTPGAGPAAATTAIPGIGDGSSYSNILGPKGGLQGPLGDNPIVQTNVSGSLAQPGSGNLLPSGSPTGTQLAGASSPGATLSPPPDSGGAMGGTQPPSAGAPTPLQPGAVPDVPGSPSDATSIGTGNWIGQATQPMSVGTGNWIGEAVGGAQPDTGAPAAPSGGTWQGIKDFLGNPSGLQLAGAGLSGIGLISQLGNRNPYGQQIAQLEQQGTGAASMATALQSPTFTGIMPPGVQASIDQQKRDATAAIRSNYARVGMAGSTSEAQQIAAENARIDAQKIGIEQNMMQQAAGYAGLAPKDMQLALQDQMTQDQNLQNAIARFAASLAGGRGGATQPTGQLPSA